MPRVVPLVLITAILGAEPAPPPHAVRSVDFDKDVQPILVKHCFACHDEKKGKGGLQLDRKREALAGGDSGPAIVPGKAGDSLLILRLLSDDASERMPLKAPRLSDKELLTLQNWIT